MTEKIKIKSNKVILRDMQTIAVLRRIFIFLIMSISVIVIYQKSSDLPIRNLHSIISSVENWDTAYYLEIIKNGYGQFRSILSVFYSLIPLMINIFSFGVIDLIIIEEAINLISTLFTTFVISLLLAALKPMCKEKDNLGCDWVANGPNQSEGSKC